MTEQTTNKPTNEQYIELYNLLFDEDINMEAFEGYELDYDKVGKLANTAQEFIDYIQTICKNPIPRFNDYSRKIYLEKYSNESVVQKFRTILK